MYSSPVDLSFSYLRSAVEASLDIKKVQVEPNTIIRLKFRQMLDWKSDYF